jgi:hypothetical protein
MSRKADYIYKALRKYPSYLFLRFCDEVPDDADLTNFPLTKLNLRDTMLVDREPADFLPDWTDYGNNYVCLGKIIEPTEKDIRLWLTQLKVCGSTLENFTRWDNPLSYCIIGDWKKRKKLSDVKEFKKRHFYVKEELAYWRTRESYMNTDSIWYYVGYSGEKHIWYEYEFINIKTNKGANKIHEIKKQPRGMVELKVNQNGYQER